MTHSGIATRLTPEEAQIVRMMPGVASVERERVYEMDTFRTPFFIGADKIWDGTAVPGGVGTRGQGVLSAGSIPALSRPIPPLLTTRRAATTEPRRSCSARWTAPLATGPGGFAMAPLQTMPMATDRIPTAPQAAILCPQARFRRPPKQSRVWHPAPIPVLTRSAPPILALRPTSRLVLTAFYCTAMLMW